MKCPSCGNTDDFTEQNRYITNGQEKELFHTLECDDCGYILFKEKVNESKQTEKSNKSRPLSTNDNLPENFDLPDD